MEKLTKLIRETLNFSNYNKPKLLVSNKQA